MLESPKRAQCHNASTLTSKLSMETSPSQTASDLAHSLMLASQWHAFVSAACFLILCNISEIKTPSHPLVTLQSWRRLSQSFFAPSDVLFSHPIHRSPWLVVDWMGTIMKKESAGVQQLRADLAEESLRVIERDACVWQTVCEACAVAQVFRLRGSGGRRFPTACCLPGGYHTQIPSRSGDALTTFFHN